MKRHKKDFRELSNKKCVECQRRLKQNLIDKNPVDYLTVKAPETKEPIILSNFSRDAAGNLVKIH